MRKIAVRVALVAAATTMGIAGGAPVPAEAKALSQFITKCSFTHQAMDDPIVRPGQPGASHLHQFFGNTSTDAFSTYDTLRAGGTTCSNPGDTAAYWVPALYQNGVQIMPQRLQAYYRNPAVSSTIQPFPAGLRMIAGDSMATTPQPNVWYACGMMLSYSSTPPTCAPGDVFKVRIHFPNCWNGVDLDSADHKSHMAYSIGKLCPGNYPVMVPLIEFNINYKTTGGSGVTLASGSPYSLHGDFFNSWDQSRLEHYVAYCLQGIRFCGDIATVP